MANHPYRVIGPIALTFFSHQAHLDASQSYGVCAHALFECLYVEVVDLIDT